MAPGTFRDRQSARDYILSELAEADTLTGPVTEPCGWEGHYVRVNLSVIADGLMASMPITIAPPIMPPITPTIGSLPKNY